MLQASALSPLSKRTLIMSAPKKAPRALLPRGTSPAPDSRPRGLRRGVAERSTIVEEQRIFQHDLEHYQKPQPSFFTKTVLRQDTEVQPPQKTCFRRNFPGLVIGTVLASVVLFALWKVPVHHFSSTDISVAHPSTEPKENRSSAGGNVTRRMPSPIEDRTNATEPEEEIDEP